MTQADLQVLFFFLFFIPLIFFFLTLQNTLRIISTPNRRMHPAAVWLMIIPIFGVVWQLVVVTRVAESIRDECIKLDIPFKERRPTFTTGAIYCFSFLIFLIPALKAPAALLVLVTWIVYWIEVNKYKKLLEANPGDR